MHSASALLDAFADPNVDGAFAYLTPVYDAATIGASEILELLLEQDGDPVTSLSDDFPDAEMRGTNAVHQAIIQGEVGAVRVLLDAAADISVAVNAGTFKGLTGAALAHAAHAPQLQMLR